MSQTSFYQNTALTAPFIKGLGISEKSKLGMQLLGSHKKRLQAFIALRKGLCDNACQVRKLSPVLVGFDKDKMQILAGACLNDPYASLQDAAEDYLYRQQSLVKS